MSALEQGYEVHIATSLTRYKDTLQDLGFKVHPLKLERSSVGLVSNIITFFQIMTLFMRIRPNIVHLITIKPLLFGGIASRITFIPCVVASVTGLGYIFTSEGIKTRLILSFIRILYRLALNRRNISVIFQNQDDLLNIEKLTGISKEKVSIIKGSGVDLDTFNYTPLQVRPPIVILPARLLIDKGVREFILAAKKLRKDRSKARFVLVGEPDMGNPSSILEKEIKNWENDGIIEYWGFRKDMPQVLASSYMVVLPSYREGLPKSLVEAAACGRAVVTTDVPGCRDAIIANKTGILVPSKDHRALAKAIKNLLDNRSICSELGKAGRVLAESSFDIKEVVARHMEIYQRLLKRYF
jgi:glycosyltransferase involved in cell wall biosynthesis